MAYPIGTKAILRLRLPSLLRVNGKACRIVGFDRDIRAYRVVVDDFPSEILATAGDLEVQPEDIPDDPPGCRPYRDLVAAAIASRDEDFEVTFEEATLIRYEAHHVHFQHRPDGTETFIGHRLVEVETLSRKP